MAYKPLWDWMDKQEGHKEGESTKALEKEKVRQGHNKKKKEMAEKMPKWKKHDSVHKTYAQSKAYDRVMDKVDPRKWRDIKHDK